ncbi:signal peptidase I SipW [Microbacteriaceae bacterium 4G12]
MKKVWKVISSLISVVLFALMISLAFMAISSKVSGGSPNVFGYQLKTVLSGSMEPVFHTGSIVAIKPTTPGQQYKKGDVITFKLKDETVVTHRIIEVQQANGKVSYKTQGDSNKTADVDPVLSENVIGQYKGFTIPYVGYLLNYANSKAGAALLLIVPGVILLLYSFYSIFTSLRQIDGSKKDKDSDAGQSV